MFRRLALALFIALVGPTARAAEITLGAFTDDPGDRNVMMHVRGDIEPGDAERFETAVAEAKTAGREVFGVTLNSPGGSLREG